MCHQRRPAALVVLLLALTACTPEPAAPDPPRSSLAIADATDDQPGQVTGSTLRVAVGEPGTLMPGDATSPAELVLVDALFDSLTTWTSTGEVVPRAAVRWEASSDATRWTFRMRPGAIFHDGTPVTARDAKWAWERAVASGKAGYHLRDVEGYEALASGQADELSGVSAESERTLEVTLSRPMSDFPAVVAHPSLAPLPEAAWTRDPQTFAGQPVGNGPFAMAEPWTGDDGAGFVRVIRFERWRNAPTPGQVTQEPEPVDLAEVVFRFMDPQTAYVAFQQERVDVAEVPGEALDAAVGRYGRAPDGYTGSGVLLGQTPELYALGFNVTVEPFDDPEVRRAVSLAVDRQALLDAQDEGNVSLARALVPDGVPGARSGRCRSCTQRAATAELLLAERGITELELWTSRGTGHGRVANRLRSDLREVGVDLAVRALDFGDYLAAVRDGAAGMYRLGWAVDYPTMDNALYPLFHSSATVDGVSDAGHNVGRYRAEDVDELLEAARSTLDPQERTLLYQQVEDLVLNRDHAVVPLLGFGHQLVVADRVEGLAVSPMGTFDLDEVSLRDGDE